MSDQMNPETNPPTPPVEPDRPASTTDPASAGTNSGEGPTLGYCRACGKALDAASMRTANGTIYCAQHMPPPPPPGSGFAGMPGAPAGGSSGAPPSPGSSASSYRGYEESPYTRQATPASGASTSPGLAFVLGWIPGVGAIYNGQYSKGAIHIVIFGMLISMADSATNNMEALFGLMITGFLFYMAFEAFHTARRRRAGYPVDEFSGLINGPGTSRIPLAPILLIVFGLVFLLNNLELLDLRAVLQYGFPVVMILTGIYMLFVRMANSRAGNGQPANPFGSPESGSGVSGTSGNEGGFRS